MTCECIAPAGGGWDGGPGECGEGWESLTAGWNPLLQTGSGLQHPAGIRHGVSLQGEERAGGSRSQFTGAETSCAE